MFEHIETTSALFADYRTTLRLLLSCKHSGKIKQICAYDSSYNCNDPSNADEELKAYIASAKTLIEKLNNTFKGKTLSNLKSADDSIMQMFDSKELEQNLFAANTCSMCIAKGLSICKEMPLYKRNAIE